MNRLTYFFANELFVAFFSESHLFRCRRGLASPSSTRSSTSVSESDELESYPRARAPGASRSQLRAPLYL